MLEHSPSIAGAVGRLRLLPYHAEFAALPESTRTHLMAAIEQPAPVDAVVMGFEALWAVRDQLGEHTRAVAADLAYQVQAGRFHGKSDRADAARRWLHVDAGVLAAEGLPDAPEADAKFVPTVEITEVEALPAPEPEPDPAA